MLLQAASTLRWTDEESVPRVDGDASLTKDVFAEPLVRDGAEVEALLALCTSRESEASVHLPGQLEVMVQSCMWA